MNAYSAGKVKIGSTFLHKYSYICGTSVSSWYQNEILCVCAMSRKSKSVVGTAQDHR